MPSRAPHGSQFPGGSHACWIVGEKECYPCAAAAFLAQAGPLGQRPVAFAPAGSPVLAALKPVAALAADPAADILGGGPLDPAALAAALREQTALAKADGQRGVRLVADMSWLHPTGAGPEAITAWETILDRLTAELNATVICAYQNSSFPQAAITGALAVHSLTRGHHAGSAFQFTSEGTRLWRLAGEVDVSVTPLLQAAVTAAARLGDCTIDLAGLRFTDLSGTRAIARTARDAAIELRCPPPAFRRYWQLCGFASTAPGPRLTYARHGAATPP